MFTNKAVEGMIGWAEAVKHCDLKEAEKQLQQFRHVGASLVASKEFQQRFEEHHNCKIEPSNLECFCQFLAEIAEIEVKQIKEFDRP